MRNDRLSIINQLLTTRPSTRGNYWWFCSSWLFSCEDLSCVLQLLHEDGLTCQSSMSSATAWLIQQIQTRSGSARTSAAEMWHISSHMWTSVTSHFIHFLLWLSHKAGAPPTSHPGIRSRALTFGRSWGTGSWRQQEQKQSQHGALSAGRRRKPGSSRSVAGAALKGHRDRSASPDSFYRRGGQTPNSTHKY